MPKPAQKEERGFRYQKRDKETLKERANMKGGNFDTIFKPKFKQWKPKDGKNLIRILPPTWDDARHYGLDIFVNYNIGADNQSYLSLGKHDKGEDPLMEARREAQKEGDKDLVKALSPNQRILYWIVDRNDEDEGPLLWAAPFTFDKSLSNLCIDEDTKEVIFIDDPAKGRDVRFYKEGTGLLTKYDPSKMKVLGPSPICEDESLENDWLDFIQANSLPDTLNFYDYDHIKATFDGVAGRRDEDEDEDKPARRKPRDEPEDKPARSRTRSKPDPEDEPEEKPTARRGPRRDQEEDEPEEKPRSRRRADPEDEPDEKPKSRRRAEPEDEDEPDEKPKAKARRAAEPEDEDEPPKRTRSRAADPEDEDNDPPSTRRTKKSDADEEGGGSLRDRIARRRSRASEDD